MLLKKQRKVSTTACKWYHDLPEKKKVNKKQDYGCEKYKNLFEHEKRQKRKKG